MIKMKITSVVKLTRRWSFVCIKNNEYIFYNLLLLINFTIDSSFIKILSILIVFIQDVIMNNYE